MILLEDSDLHAVISYLKIIEHSHVNKIWIQISIKHKFEMLMKKHFRLKDFSIQIFRSFEHLSSHTSCNINVTSIWSENIACAKKLATELNRNIVFINTHLNFFGGIMFLPYLKIVNRTILTSNFNNTPIQSNIFAYRENFLHISDKEIEIFNLFYDGTWHKPVNNTYWECNNRMWANATSEDIKMCLDSAIRGFRTWAVMTFDTRQTILHKIIDELRLNSEIKSSIINMIHETYLYKESLNSQNDSLEIIENRIPKGVIILKDKNEVNFFHLLMLILISGNSTIVIDDPNSYSLVRYCEIFSVYLPSGVLNYLSNEDTSNIEIELCWTDYENYKNQIFVESNFQKTFLNLTVPKQIILTLK
ncbi:uncharacterized protein LOC105431217 isoform X5 [Pogonomyrmex barbatus]|uniref:Uncharacterized protein LOC105431217 isoform X5 n=1 Tax=Pogonomyrmex barbatus TaxID=144034 RepID=A0A8N1SAI5_9HYME|nr:uncharacterized protein LOC105431217 isoform X5 [Pogonomyrmex barbatus]